MCLKEPSSRIPSWAYQYKMLKKGKSFASSGTVTWIMDINCSPCTQLHMAPPFITTRAPNSMNQQVHPPDTSTADRSWSVDHTLAARYVQLLPIPTGTHHGESHRAQHGHLSSQSFHVTRSPYFSTCLPVWRYGTNLIPAAWQLHSSPQVQGMRR